MKKLLLLSLTIIMFATQVDAKKKKESTLEVTYRFDNIIDGYDHDTKAIISIDDKEVLTTSPKKQSAKQTVTLKIPAGTFQFNLMMMALYEGTWEEHTKANNYSVDCFIDDEFKTKGGAHTLDIVFDIDTELTTYKFK